jgi:hypothetical protein
MKLHFVDTMDHVLAVALERPLPEVEISGETAQPLPLPNPPEGPAAHQ